MSKYLLIPVKEIEEKIFLITGNNKYVYEDDGYMEENYPDAYTLKQLLNTSKQVSLELTEKQKANLADLAWKESVTNDQDFIRGYKRALEDLI